MSARLDRRLFVTGAAGLALAGCDSFAESSGGQTAFKAATDLTQKVQRAVMGDGLAPEYASSAISKVFKANGSIDPKDPAYKKMAEEKFTSYSLSVGGMVEIPRGFTLADLRALPSRTQITRHDCVEGWSCIGQWTGAPLGQVLDLVKPKPKANFVVFHCFDHYATDYTTDALPAGQDIEDSPAFYGSISKLDAYHPQTILAYDMNGEPLPVAYGAPLRVRVERQLGYKMTKYIKSIELVANFADIGEGKGGYWEDQGYQWYGGI